MSGEELTPFSKFISLLANTSHPVELCVLFSFIDDSLKSILGHMFIKADLYRLTDPVLLLGIQSVIKGLNDVAR